MKVITGFLGVYEWVASRRGPLGGGVRTAGIRVRTHLNLPACVTERGHTDAGAPKILTGCPDARVDRHH